MTHPTHDTLVDLDRGTPRPFIAAAFSLPALIGLQFIVAGQALFGSLSWEPHGTLGGLIGIWVLAILGYSLVLPRLRGFGWWTGVLTLLYALQLALASSGPAALAFHPFNAGLLLTASLVLVVKVERRRSFRSGDV
ncbi:DUF6220 domain-containing protein [Roseivivax isoporae]|uniref:Uncharacterized protein n=1 Tax=Roseivivax isoporae LMG 25204 TaxID=1449351 RepID=X7F2G3_9RHOB|nr:DUF6220 domain-containing protein [Roseivivax isoporae]ETX26970.1 hypothetical protein RISW2_17290 [Roseivivax isoporae LMG 25204]